MSTNQQNQNLNPQQQNNPLVPNGPNYNLHQNNQFQAPQMPTQSSQAQNIQNQLPQLDLGRLPDAGAGLQNTLDQIAMLPGKWDPQLTQVKNEAAHQFTGLGDWKFGKDDPNTMEREDLTLTQRQASINSEKARRYREQEMVNRVEQAQRNMLNSTFAKRNLGAAFDKLTLEGQQVARQFMANIADKAMGWQEEQANLVTQATTQFGEAASWLAQNPPPPPPDQYMKVDGNGGPVHTSYAAPPNFADLQQRYPGMHFEVHFDGEKFTTSASPAPGDSMWSPQQWHNLGAGGEGEVWRGSSATRSGIPDINVLNNMYPGAQFSIREEEDYHGNTNYIVTARKTGQSQGDYVSKQISDDSLRQTG